MTLYLIGLGLNDEKDITLRGLEAIRKCKTVYLESYTSLLQCPIAKLEKRYKKKIILADREMVEQHAEETILANATGKKDAAFLVIGDPMAATTHADLFLRAKERGIDVRIINNASIMNPVANTGLELYTFGKTTSLVFPRESWMPESPYDVIKANRQFGLHTLCLLDIQIEPARRGSKESIGMSRFMTVNEGIRYLLDIAKKRNDTTLNDDTLLVGCARLGSEDAMIRAGKAKELLKMDFGRPLHCLIVPGELHFKEEEMLKAWE